MMIELFVVIGAIVLAVAFIGAFAKLLVSLVLLPLQVGLWLLKGVFVLLLVVPLVIISLGAASFILPVIFSVFALPVILGVVGIVLLIRFFV